MISSQGRESIEVGNDCAEGKRNRKKEKERERERETRSIRSVESFDRRIERMDKVDGALAAYNHGLPGFFMGNLW